MPIQAYTHAINTASPASFACEQHIPIKNSSCVGATLVGALRRLQQATGGHKTRLSMTLFSALLLAACASAPETAPPPAPPEIPAAFDAPAAHVNEAHDLRQWWRAWGDARMSALIETALAASPDIRAAAARWQAAREVVVQAHSAQLPTVLLGAGVDAAAARLHSAGDWRTLAPPYSSALVRRHGTALGADVALGATWEFDVFGSLSATERAATAAASVAAEKLHGAHTLLAGEVARTWRQALALRRQQRTLEEGIATAQQLLGYVNARFGAGQANAADVDATAAHVAHMQAARAPLAEQLAARGRLLAVLCGQAPQQPDAELASLLAFLNETDGAATPPPAAPGGQHPATMLQRRADVRARAAAVHAHAAQLEGARADLLPRIGLDFLGASGQVRLTGLPDAGSSGALLGLRLTLPLFTAGRLQARVREGDALLRAAALDFEGAVLHALREVEDAYAARLALEARISQLERALRDARRAASRTQKLYAAGQKLRSDALAAQLAAQQAQQALHEAQAQRDAAAIALYQALGGGW